MAKTKQTEPQQVQQQDVKTGKAVNATTLGSVGFGKYKPIPHFRNGCKNC